MRERVAILGGVGWTNHSLVRRCVRALPPDAVVLLDDDPFDANVAALRECRCAVHVAVVHRLPTNAGRKAIEARKLRDLVLLETATRVVVFGELSPDRELTLGEHARAGLAVERRYEEADEATSAE